MVKENIDKIKEDIYLICQKISRNPEEITIVCVTKEQSVDKIKEAIDSGLTNVGENRLQDAYEKFSALKQLIAETKVKYHMVGHLQTNKVKKALEIFDLIHSVDSLHLAKEIDKQAVKLNKIADVLIQVNTSAEATKFGISEDNLAGLLKEITHLKNIRVLGLMTIAPFTDNVLVIRDCFRRLRLLKDRIAEDFSHENIRMDYLSMGMTNDYQIAVEEGANMLRIGRRIFSDVR